MCTRRSSGLGFRIDGLELRVPNPLGFRITRKRGARNLGFRITRKRGARKEARGKRQEARGTGREHEQRAREENKGREGDLSAEGDTKHHG